MQSQCHLQFNYDVVIVGSGIIHMGFREHALNRITTMLAKSDCVPLQCMGDSQAVELCGDWCHSSIGTAAVPLDQLRACVTYCVLSTCFVPCRLV